MPETITASQLGEAIGGEMAAYSLRTAQAVDKVVAVYADKFYRTTRKTAPYRRHKGRHYRSSIQIADQSTGLGTRRYLWYVNAPDYRRTHLLEHGHKGGFGGVFVHGSHFIERAQDAVLVEMEAKIEEAIQNAD